MRSPFSSRRVSGITQEQHSAQTPRPLGWTRGCRYQQQDTAHTPPARRLARCPTLRLSGIRDASPSAVPAALCVVPSRGVPAADTTACGAPSGAPQCYTASKQPSRGACQSSDPRGTSLAGRRVHQLSREEWCGDGCTAGGRVSCQGSRCPAIHRHMLCYGEQ